MNLAWGGYTNGQIPNDKLVGVGKSDADHGSKAQHLEAEAAQAYQTLDAVFYRQFHKHLIVNDGYRDLTTQQELYAAYKAHPETNALAAYPGTSNHGWARAADFGSNVQYKGTPEALWMREHAKEYGFDDSGYGFARVEPWHYDWLPGTATASLDLTPVDLTRKNDDMQLKYDTNGAGYLFTDNGYTVLTGQEWELFKRLKRANEAGDFANPNIDPFLAGEMAIIAGAIRRTATPVDVAAIAGAVVGALPAGATESTPDEIAAAVIKATAAQYTK